MLRSRPWGPGDAGGAARIVESIDYDFGSRERHGIYRDIPGLPVGDPVQVASPTAPTSWLVRRASRERVAPGGAAEAAFAAAGPAVTRHPRLAPLLLSGTSGSSVQPCSSGSGGGGGAGGGGGGSW